MNDQDKLLDRPMILVFGHEYTQLPDDYCDYVRLIVVLNHGLYTCKVSYQNNVKYRLSSPFLKNYLNNNVYHMLSFDMKIPDCS